MSVYPYQYSVTRKRTKEVVEGFCVSFDAALQECKRLVEVGNVKTAIVLKEGHGVNAGTYFLYHIVK